MTDLASISSDLRVLLVDDTPTNLAVLKEALASENYKLAFANSGEKALEIIPKLLPNLILLDIMMPGIDGYETCTRLKQNPKTKDIPIIFITAKKETDDIIKGFQVGGVDYITKPFQQEEVCARIKNHLELQFLRKQNEEKMKATMSRYMGSELVDTLMENGKEMMGTSKHDVTILFSDIRRFTSIAEELGVDETVQLLKEYFSLMVDCIHKEKGMLDKFIGDAVMAVYGAPIPLMDHADRGVTSAISMIKTLNKFNFDRKASGKIPLEIGIGLNSAPVISGNIGSAERMDYTVIGDGVNTAARIESSCKYYGTSILICEYTVKGLKGQYQLRELDRVYFKGKAKPRRVFEVMDYHNEETFPNLEKVVSCFGEGLKMFRENNMKEAIFAFKESLSLNPNDRASQIYIERCQKFIDNPPDKEWEGIWELESK
jgi:class 3 adenylate cyclase